MLNSEPTQDNQAVEKSGEESSRPKNVPARLWEKFKALEKRTNETTKRSTEKRIKHLQKTALENVARALRHPEDLEIVKIPRADDAKLDAGSLVSSDSPSISGTTAARKRELDHGTRTGTSIQGRQKSCKTMQEAESTANEAEEWKRVQGLMGVNDHLEGVSHGSLGPKTVLETKIETAIADGDLKKAEELSDHMASREFGEKIAKAIDAKNFLQHKQKEEEMTKAKRKKKLHWGFEAKQRWETKGNM
ncbi:protein FAM204A-like [Littorina saxatilis]|uniref:Protein FAM204A n=1 Tax=Littorina saxatilis TaxID=31220 RepID=A0AAN9GKM1_9CAEN